VGATGLGGLWALEYKATEPKSEIPVPYSFRGIRVHIYDFFKFVGGLWALMWAWQTFFTSIDRY